ncbi:gamma-glutamylcyclotransferase [Sphingomonas canadensis]|uniref:Gamma-glutamylcyclotransferase n=1 Tax=Sphingomonas canadensis TaxID=1219257 RepID=A0ABW3H898_9SPHN|nr:gamma-glutamylcyclotransferase family protein [Sphingomonas canadensis]MCW3836883.1 gamma-glutamylcyclotransferase [Sphingomonas canadensis]
MERFFFYGLLRRGQRGHAQFRLGERMRFVGDDAVNGTVRDLGLYPGLTLGGEGQVAGEVHETADPKVIADLDAYEGYDPAKPLESEYIRKKVTTVIGDSVWIYEHNAAANAGRER